MQTLKGFQAKHLRALAHSLKPVVLVGQKGVSPSLLGSIQEALNAHELIKIKFIDFKEKAQKIALSDEIEQRTGSALVGMIGHIGVFYRRHEDPAVPQRLRQRGRGGRLAEHERLDRRRRRQQRPRQRRRAGTGPTTMNTVPPTSPPPAPPDPHPGLIYALERAAFSPWLVRAVYSRVFRADSALCTRCGRCARVCPSRNIAWEKGERPTWERNCAGCFACVEACPESAIRSALDWALLRPFLAYNVRHAARDSSIDHVRVEVRRGMILRLQSLIGESFRQHVNVIRCDPELLQIMDFRAEEDLRCPLGRGETFAAVDAAGHFLSQTSLAIAAVRIFSPGRIEGFDFGLVGYFLYVPQVGNSNSIIVKHI